MIGKIGDAVLPVSVFWIVSAAAFRNIPLFDVFIEGAKEGLRSSVQLLPTLLGLITAVYVLQASSVLDIVCGLLEPFARLLCIPQELIPLAFLRPVSGSGASAYTALLLERCGPDSTVGRMASVLTSSTETTFYITAVYLSGGGYTKSSRILPAALLGDLTAVVVTVCAVRLLY